MESDIGELLSGIEKAHWHLSSGRQFKEAYWFLIGQFDVVNKVWTHQVEMPAYYCAGLATEHFLKSFLTLKDKKYPIGPEGHNLIGLFDLEDTTQQFFSLSNEEKSGIEILNQRYYFDPRYGKYDLRYPSKSGLRQSPHPDWMHAVLKKMELQLNSRFSF